MTSILINNSPVIEGTISAPRSGAWYMEAQVHANLSEGDSVTITDGSEVLSGTVVSGAVAVSRAVVRIVGGSGGLANEIGTFHRKNSTVGAILQEICSKAGETKSAAILPSISQDRFPFWTQPRETAGRALKNLADSKGVVWRVLKDGTVWLGDPNLGAPEPDWTILEPHPEDRAYDVAPEGLSLWVGKLQNGAAVQRVEYSIGDALRCTYWI